MLREFEIPFQYRGDPVAKATLLGCPIDRCVLDTGAAKTVIRIPSDGFSHSFKISDEGDLALESLIIGDVEFGPLQIKAKFAEGLRVPEIYLGTKELASYCISIDYTNSIAKFTSNSLLESSSHTNTLSFSNGRPIIEIEINGSIKKFVLDTGSNGNWIFYSSQTPDFLSAGVIREKEDLAECGLGNIKIEKEISFSNLKIGGIVHDSISFNLANENSFGGPRKTMEDGIIGTGYFEASKWKIHIIDFISMNYGMTL